MLLVLIALSGCSSKIVPYEPEPVASAEYAANVIEQVSMQQPTKYRPESVLVTSDYIAYGEGYSGKSVGFGSATSLGSNGAIGLGVSRVKGKNINDRLYFNSLGPSKLWVKRGWYIIDIQNKTPSRVKRLYSRDKNAAEAFIDSINYMVEKSIPIK